MNTIPKRCAALLLSTALLLPLLAPSSRAATSVNVSVNGTPVAFPAPRAPRSWTRMDAPKSPCG